MSEENANYVRTEIKVYYQHDIDKLQAENKRLREALEEINKVKLYNMPVIQGYGEKNYLKWYDLEHSAALNMQSLAQQALGE